MLVCSLVPTYIYSIFICYLYVVVVFDASNFLYMHIVAHIHIPIIYIYLILSIVCCGYFKTFSIYRRVVPLAFFFLIKLRIRMDKTRETYITNNNVEELSNLNKIKKKTARSSRDTAYICFF